MRFRQTIQKDKEIKRKKHPAATIGKTFPPFHRVSTHTDRKGKTKYNSYVIPALSSDTYVETLATASKLILYEQFFEELKAIM